MEVWPWKATLGNAGRYGHDVRDAEVGDGDATKLIERGGPELQGPTEVDGESVAARPGGGLVATDTETTAQLSGARQSGWQSGWQSECHFESQQVWAAVGQPATVLGLLSSAGRLPQRWPRYRPSTANPTAAFTSGSDFTSPRPPLARLRLQQETSPQAWSLADLSSSPADCPCIATTLNNTSRSHSPLATRAPIATAALDSAGPRRRSLMTTAALHLGPATALCDSSRHRRPVAPGLLRRRA
ncbi:hypothetical protein CDD82_7643 [Ophiocordyceps australis]|uniref:Uncharacterized protein n=1 Tax=Ophiocordyceps australis TaxID=1399860 RepID=A0A2C5ZLF8_9HYPO|nr:hypothetical protein CDD82_7643 [Ophiocordyceps australis]